jgi:branched-chain amino acid transport system permease protein
VPLYVRAGISAAALAAVIVILNGAGAGPLLAFLAGPGAAVLALTWQADQAPAARRRAAPVVRRPQVASSVYPRRERDARTSIFLRSYLQQPADARAGDAVRVATLAGGSAGLVLLLTQVFRDWILSRLAGLPVPPVAGTLQNALVALAVATAAGAVFGAVELLPAGRRPVATYGLLGGFLVLYPFLDSAAGVGWIGQMIAVLIFVLLALGLNIVVGYAGLLDLGYAAFFAIGAYTTALLSSPQLGIYWNFWLVIWLAAAVAALFGVILGAPTLPLRGDYLAIVTLGFGEIVPVVFRNLTAVVIREPFTGFCLAGCAKPLNLTGGIQGINPIGRPALPLLGEFRPGQYVPWFYLILGLIVFSVFLINRLYRSRLGRAWTAIREDELAAATMGIDLVRTKLLAFAMGATFSGFAGAFYAAYIAAIFPDTFRFDISVIVLCMVILGGMGNMTGVILGGLIIMGADRIFLPQFASLAQAVLNTSVFPLIPNPALRETMSNAVDPSQLRLLLFGLTLVIMMLVRPEGLVPSARRRAELREDEPAEEIQRATAAPSEVQSPAATLVGD